MVHLRMQSTLRFIKLFVYRNYSATKLGHYITSFNYRIICSPPVIITFVSAQF